MQNTKPMTENVKPKADEKQRKPNEKGSISVQAHMRIFDPKTQKTYVEGRG